MYGPVLAGDKLIVCGGYGWDRDGRLAALNPTNGHSQWEHVVGWCYAPPVVAGNVAVGVGRQHKTMTIMGVDIDTGRLRWQRSFPKPYSWRPPLLRGTWIYMDDGSQTVVVLDAVSGSYREITLPACMPKPRGRTHLWGAVDERRAIFGCGAHVFLLAPEATTPRLLATLDTSLIRPDEVVLHEDVIHVADNNYRTGKGRLIAFDLRTGRQLWQRRSGQARSLKVTGDHLYAHIAGKTGGLVALDPLTGVERWRAGVRGAYPPLLRNGRLYVDDTDWRVLAFRIAVVDSATGKVIGRRPVPGEIAWTPAIAHDKLLFGTLEGALYALRFR